MIVRYRNFVKLSTLLLVRYRNLYSLIKIMMTIPRLLEAEKFLSEAAVILKYESRSSPYGHLADSVRQEGEQDCSSHKA